MWQCRCSCECGEAIRKNVVFIFREVMERSYVIGINGSGKDHKGTAELRKQIEAVVNHTICIGSRESRLAVIQSEMVMDYLKKECPQKEIRLLTMKTTGDKILDWTLDKVGGKGLFVKELDKALLDSDVCPYIV